MIAHMIYDNQLLMIIIMYNNHLNMYNNLLISGFTTTNWFITSGMAMYNIWYNKIHDYNHLFVDCVITLFICMDIPRSWLSDQ